MLYALSRVLYAICSICPLYVLPRPPVGASGFFRGQKKTVLFVVFTSGVWVCFLSARTLLITASLNSNTRATECIVQRNHLALHLRQLVLIQPHRSRKIQQTRHCCSIVIGGGSSVPPLTSVAGLTLACADAIAGSTFIAVRSRIPLWETGRHPRNCSGSQDCQSRIYRGARARSPGRWDFPNPRPISFFRWILSVSTFLLRGPPERSYQYAGPGRVWVCRRL